MYHLRATVTLNFTSGLVFRIIMSGAYLFFNSRLESHIRCVNASLDDRVSRSIIGLL